MERGEWHGWGKRTDREVKKGGRGRGGAFVAQAVWGRIDFQKVEIFNWKSSFPPPLHLNPKSPNG